MYQNWTVNIGFADNPFTLKEIVDNLYSIFGDDSLITYRKESGMWEGKPEVTLVATGSTEATDVAIIHTLANLSDKMNQEAIAISCEHFDMLVYGYKAERNIPTKDRVKFNEEYFIKYSK